MVKIYPYFAGNTLRSHEKFLKKLSKKGAKTVCKQEDSEVTIVFCPIVSRFETDIESALSSFPERQEIILVAMHHTHDPNYTLPDDRYLDKTVRLLVQCLFHERKGLLKCDCNEKAKKMVCKELDLSGRCCV